MTTVMDLSNALAGAVERVSGWMFAVHGRPRVPSTGVQWRTGLVVTANHTVEHDREVTLTGHDGRSFAASVAGRDPSLDIAVLRAVVDGVSAADVADDGDVRVGHLVMALGAGPRASAGIVSALDVGRGRHAAGDLLAVDLTLYPGFSGGPLVDVRGRVIGITTSGASRHLQCAIRATAVTRLVEADHRRRDRLDRWACDHRAGGSRGGASARSGRRGGHDDHSSRRRAAGPSGDRR